MEGIQTAFHSVHWWWRGLCLSSAWLERHIGAVVPHHPCPSCFSCIQLIFSSTNGTKQTGSVLELWFYKPFLGLLCLKRNHLLKSFCSHSAFLTVFNWHPESLRETQVTFEENFTIILKRRGQWQDSSCKANPFQRIASKGWNSKSIWGDQWLTAEYV